VQRGLSRCAPLPRLWGRDPQDSPPGVVCMVPGRGMFERWLGRVPSRRIESFQQQRREREQQRGRDGRLRKQRRSRHRWKLRKQQRRRRGKQLRKQQRERQQQQRRKQRERKWQQQRERQREQQRWVEHLRPERVGPDVDQRQCVRWQSWRAVRVDRPERGAGVPLSDRELGDGLRAGRDHVPARHRRWERQRQRKWKWK
jgi:hypothetical protein